MTPADFWAEVVTACERLGLLVQIDERDIATGRRYFVYAGRSRVECRFNHLARVEWWTQDLAWGDVLRLAPLVEYVAKLPSTVVLDPYHAALAERRRPRVPESAHSKWE